MRVWKVLPALLFLTSTLNAQSGFYTDPCDQVFYSGAYPPYCYSQPYYYPRFSLSNTLLTVNNDGAMNALTRQVQELSEQVRELSAEIALAKAQQLQPGPTLPEVIVPRPPCGTDNFHSKERNADSISGIRYRRFDVVDNDSVRLRQNRCGPQK